MAVGFSGWDTLKMVKHANSVGESDVCGIKNPGLRRVLNDEATKGLPFSHVAILGGTNDLAFKFTAQEIFENLVQLHEMAHSCACISFAISIPPTHGDETGNYPAALVAVREEVNALLRTYAANTDMVHFVDTSGVFSAKGTHPKRMPPCWFPSVLPLCVHPPTAVIEG
jgi:hypothetical protein